MILLSKGQHKFTLSGERNTIILLDHTQFPDTFLINWRKRFIEDEFISLNLSDKFIEVEREFIGWEVFFALDYSTSADQDLLFKIGQIEDSLVNNTTNINLMVRDDDETFTADVMSITDDINLRLLFGDNAYEGVKLYFRTKKTQKLLNWQKQPIIIDPGVETQAGISIDMPHVITGE